MVFESIYQTPLFFRIETYVTRHIENKQKGLLHICIKEMLYVFSLVYRFAAWARNMLYDRGWLRSHKIDAPVISVGNITAGGTGKTPLISLLCENLDPEFKLAVLSRGYRSNIEKSGKIAHLNTQKTLSALDCGDEPYMLAQTHPAVDFFVGKNRVLSAKEAEKNAADLIFLDDGLQYRKLYRDEEIIALSAEDLFGQDHFLPRGYLRDEPKRLKNADLIVINGAESTTAFLELKQKVRKFSDAPIIGTRLNIESIKSDSEVIKGKKIGLFCGLGKPSSFIKQVQKQLSFEILETLLLPDHKAPSQKDLLAFSTHCKEKGAEFLLCSEKDWVKISSKKVYPLPIAYTKARMEVVYEKQHWHHFLQTLKGRKL